MQFILSKKAVKKAQFSIVVFVFLILVLATISLIVFITDSRVDSNTIGIGYLDQLVLENERMNFYVGLFNERVFIKTYSDFVENREYWTNTRDEDFFIDILDKEKLNSGFLEVYNSNAVLEMNEQWEREFFFEDREVKSYSVDFDGVELIFERENIVFETSLNDDEYISTYLADVESSVSFHELGLHSFEEIYEVKEFCRRESPAEIKEKCMQERLPNFNVSVELSEIGIFHHEIRMETKRRYLINGELQPIVVEFAQDL